MNDCNCGKLKLYMQSLAAVNKDLDEVTRQRDLLQAQIDKDRDLARDKSILKQVDLEDL